MRFVHMGVATLATAALAACATGTSTTATGTTPTTDVNAPAGATTNTGRAVPGSTDTTKAPPSGEAKSAAAVGTGNASIGAGVTPGAGASAGASGTMLSNLGGDAHIITAVDIINTGEIAEGMLARQRGTLPQIRAFADRMVQEHTQMQTQDRALAKNPAFVAGDTADVARQMMQQSQANLASLQKQPTGAAFDALYLDDQIKEHQSALDLLNAAKTQARDGQVRDLVSAAIPKVQAHLDAAQAIRATMTAR